MTDTTKHVIAVVVYVTVAVLVAWCLWDWLAAQPDGRESRSTTVRNLALTAGVPLGLWLTMWRLRVADRQAATAQRRLEIERYQRGAEMLGSEVLSVRLGGIYALWNLAEHHPEQYHVDAMRLFCAFVGHPPEDKTIAHSDDGSDPHELLDNDQQLAKSLRLRPDVETIVEMISDRSPARIALERKRGFQLDLRHAHLQRAWLEGADLSNAVLDRADLTGANLKGANLSAATLGSTILDGAMNLTQAQLDQAGGYPDDPPKLDGVCDAQTGEPFIWRPLPIEGD